MGGRGPRRKLGRFAILLVLAAAAVPLAAAETTLIDFELKDQFDRVHTEQEFQGRILVVLGGGQQTDQYLSIWYPAIRNSVLGRGRVDRLHFLFVANMKGYPPFLRPSYRKKFTQDESAWTLMDWKGRFAKAYGWQRKGVNILVFDRGGDLVRQSHVRDLDPDELGRIADVLVRLTRRAVVSEP